jgi:hypothetical protein
VEMDVRFSPPPKRWMTVTEPDRPARMPQRRARCRWKPSSTRTDTGAPPAPARDPTRASTEAGTAGSAPTDARAPAAAPRPPAGPRSRSCAGRRSSGRSPAPCTKTAPAARACTPCTAGARNRAPGSRRSGSRRTLAPRRRQRHAGRLPPARLEEGVEVLVVHAVQHRVLGVAWPVVADAARHSGDIGALRERPQCPAMDTPQRWGHSGKDRESSASVVTPHAGHPRGRAARAQARRLVFGDVEGSARSAERSRGAAVDAAPR